MKEFITTHGVTILIMVVFAGYILYLAVTKQWAKLRVLGYKLILQAEKVITGTKAGQERFELVLKQIYGIMPPWIRFFVSEDMLRAKLQEWFNDLKEYLEDRKLNKAL